VCQNGASFVEQHVSVTFEHITNVSSTATSNVTSSRRRVAPAAAAAASTSRRSTAKQRQLSAQKNPG